MRIKIPTNDNHFMNWSLSNMKVALDYSLDYSFRQRLRFLQRGEKELEEADDFESHVKKITYQMMRTCLTMELSRPFYLQWKSLED